MRRSSIARLWLIVLLLLPAACASLTGRHDQDISKEAVKTNAVIGPYSELSGRLIVMQPHRRWQVLLQWQAFTPDQGWLRLTHAASNTILELHWQNEVMQSRSNQDGHWQNISMTQLSEQGIVLSPQQLAKLLLGQTPEHFVQKPARGHDDIIWETQGIKPFMRLQWRASSHRLTMTDMTHGRQAILIIQPPAAQTQPTSNP